MKNSYKIFLMIIIHILILCGCQIIQEDKNNTVTTDDPLIITTDEVNNPSNINKTGTLELTDEIKKSFDILFDYTNPSRTFSEIGCINNVEDAVEMATIIFNSVYKDYMEDVDFPLEVYYDDTDGYWLIQTAFVANRHGGYKHIIIRASNAEVIMISVSR